MNLVLKGSRCFKDGAYDDEGNNNNALCCASAVLCLAIVMNVGGGRSHGKEGEVAGIASNLYPHHEVYSCAALT